MNSIRVSPRTITLIAIAISVIVILCVFWGMPSLYKNISLITDTQIQRIVDENTQKVEKMLSERQNNEQKRKKIAEEINSEERLANNFISMITNEVNKNIEKREEARLQLMSIALTALFIFVSVFGWLSISAIIRINAADVARDILENEIKIPSLIKDSVKEEIENIRTEIKIERIRGELSLLAFAIDVKPEVNINDRDAIMQLFIEYKSLGGELTNNFITAFEKIASNFVLARCGKELDIIYELYGEYILQSNIKIKRNFYVKLSEHYWRKYLVTLYNNKNQDEMYPQILTRLKSYLDASKEIVLCFELGEAYAKQGSSSEKLIESRLNTSASALSNQERAAFIFYIFRYRKYQYWHSDKSEVGNVLEIIYDYIFTTFEEKIKTLITPEVKIILENRCKKTRNEILKQEFCEWVSRINN